jgi:N-acylneuraminate-9-phosphatase
MAAGNASPSFLLKTQYNHSPIPKIMKYKAIFLDMDHTLCDTKRADALGVTAFQNELSTLFPHKTALRIGDQYLSVIYGKNKSSPLWQKQPLEDETAFRARLLKQIIREESTTIGFPLEKVSYLASRFMHLRIKNFDFFPGTIEMINLLRKKYTLVLISNGPLYSQKPKIDKVEMHKYCDHIILGGELKEQKPHPSIFHMACRKAQCLPCEAIHVGDMLESDIQGAKNAEIDNVWVGSEEKMNQIGIKPDYIISQITELKMLLQKIELKASS